MPMMVNTEWLREYLEPQCSHEELLEVFPRLGLEIEKKFDLRRELEVVRFGFVRRKQALAESPGYYHCQIEVDRGETIDVVCASEHEVREGWGVPVAPPGVTLPTGKSVDVREVLGVRSTGMICLDGELGLVARGSGMQYSTDEKILGQPFSQVVSVPEYLVELNVLPNRPDFLGLIGIAREVAAILGLKLICPPLLRAPSSGPARFEVELRDPQLCPRYVGSLIEGVRVGPSPAWMKAKLLLAGMRPINNLVDITNYVLYEWGQPLHAFDFRQLRGQRIVVRKMAPNESLELLTGKVVSGKQTAANASPLLVIADAERPVALAGVMGGRASQTTEQTAEILLEAAHFDSVNIRHTVRQVDLGMEARGTASSYRFERGTDPNWVLEGAVGRALQLIHELAGGTPVGPLVDRYPEPRRPREFLLSAPRTSAYLGMPVDEATIRNCLERLDMECLTDPAGIRVRVPTWRVDVNDAVVLIEDVARMVGYEKIPATPQDTAPTQGRASAADRLRLIVATTLVNAGLFEARNASLESAQASSWLGEPAAAVTVANAATQEMSVLRRSLLPSLASTVQNNLRRGMPSVRFFEMDRVFEGAGLPQNSSEAGTGSWKVSGIVGGELQRANWRAARNQHDFFTLKGVVEDLLDAVGARDVSFQAVSQSPYSEGTATRIVRDGTQEIGFLGEIDSRVIVIERLPFRLFAFELDLNRLEEAYGTLPSYRPLPRQPAVTRDLALVMSLSVVYGRLLESIRESAGPTLETLRLVDQYQGPQVPPGHQSLAFHLVFRDSERTLTSEEAAETMERIVSTVKERWGAELRA